MALTLGSGVEIENLVDGLARNAYFDQMRPVAPETVPTQTRPGVLVTVVHQDMALRAVLSRNRHLRLGSTLSVSP